MSLKKAEDGDPKLSGITSLLKHALEEPFYTLRPDQCFLNLDSDPLVPDFPSSGGPASRLELLRHLDPHRSDPATLKQEVVGFCRASCAQGAVAPLAAHRILGRVQSLEGLAASISGASSGLRLENSKALIRDLAQEGTDKSSKLAVQKLGLTGKALSRYQVWAFPASDSRAPLGEIGETRAYAVNALGLGYYGVEKPGEELVRWAHRLPDTTEARQPTVWDAGTSAGNVYWRPWGKTCQLSAEVPGVTEVVHPPIHGEDLVHPIEVLT